ncbi:MAG: DUF1704 domain-containing protein [Candidatus Saccharibacteria bacterium]|nr:DUF1704 domain-containing protein [Candidatus Saccharibacteria bacterium]
MLYRDSTKAHDLARYIAQTVMTMNPVAMCVPTNVSDIEKEWKLCAKAGHFYSPKFTYNEAELRRISLMGYKVSNYWSELSLNCTPQNQIDSAILGVLESRVCDAILTAEIAASILAKDDARTKEAIIGIYGEPSASLIALCYDRIQRPGAYLNGATSRFDAETLANLQAMKLNAADIRKRFLEVFNFYGFKSWECIIDQQVTSAIDARDKTPSGKSQLVIPARKTVDGRALCSLIGHEIESHVRGSENSRALFGRLLANSPLEPLVNLLAKADNESFYEGVAKMSDVNVNGDNSLPHPYYVIAIDRALHGDSFAEVAQLIYLLKHTGNTTVQEAVDSSWNITRRVFRGCTDMEKGGYAHTKDFGYIDGYYRAQNTPTSYRDYSSMTIMDLRLLEDAGVDLTHPAYPHQDAIQLIVGK